MDTLQYQIDTVIHKIITSDNVYQTMLTEQHETYEWLMYFFLGIITIVIGTSLLLNFYFFDNKIRYTIKSEVEQIRTELKNEVEQARKDIEVYLREKIDKSFDDFNKIITKNHSTTMATVYLLQANNLLEKKMYYDAMVDFSYCIFLYVECEDKANIITVLDAMINFCLPNLSKTEIKKYEIHTDFNLKMLQKLLNSANIQGELTHLIENFIDAYNAAEQRILLEKDSKTKPKE